MPRDNKDNLTEEELVERFAKLFGHKPSSNKNIAKTSTSRRDLMKKRLKNYQCEEFTPSNKNFDENDDATRLIKEIQDEINLESKYKDNLYELKEKKEQDFIELEKRYKEFKIHATNENISNKNNISISSLGPPPKPIDLSEFGLDDYDLNNWCCICNEDAIIKCRDCDGDLYCQSCFNEGHLGSHSDYETKQHKFEVYNRRMN
ncbi:unnamed protein product [Rhizophagus irregularis]|nr:unnamed protein product [Rhizophagus irregularis]CAB5366645.1 unnamed protein product [Rhizophagus irregularis]